mgnify:CR=1 FL=1
MSVDRIRIAEPGAAHHPALKFFAHFFSYLFHPIFIPVYVTWFLTFVHPGYFAGFSSHQKTWIIIRVAYSMVLLPIIVVLLLKALGFSKSICLKTQQERIITYITSNIFFFWAYLVFRNQPEIPKVITAFTFGVFLACSAALLFNIRMKISMHAIGVGGLTGLLLLVMLSNTMMMGTPLSIGLLIAGMVCTSRMIVSDHTQKEIYYGFVLGFTSQIIAALIVS